VKQFAGLCSSDCPPELAPDFDEIFGEMKDKLLLLMPGNYHASVGTLSPSQATRLIKKICSLYHEVLQYELHGQFGQFSEERSPIFSLGRACVAFAPSPAGVVFPNGNRHQNT
jgi:hypothetical protein